jgi:hypothetical protein
MASKGVDADQRLLRRIVRWLVPSVAALVVLAWALVPFRATLDELAFACLGRSSLTLHARSTSCFVLRHFRAVPAEAESQDGRPLLAGLLARAVPDQPDDDVFQMASSLIDRGLSIDRYDRRSGLNALHEAILGGRPFAVAFLLVRGANPELPVGTAAGPPLAGERPLQLVSRFLERNDSENARARAQTVADLLREAIRSVREEQAAMPSDQPR